MRMKKVAVIGSNGLLGQHLATGLLRNKDYRVFAFASGVNRNPLFPEEDYYALDIGQTGELEKQLQSLQPGYIVNCVAMTQVDLCEEQREACKRVNVDFVEELVRISAGLDAHLVHISTDFVFDGKTGMYRETDPVNPVNYYGYTKVLSEEAVREKLPRHTILRTILVYGEVFGMKKSNILLWIKNALQAGERLRIVTDQWRMPTYVGNLADACIASMERNARGTFHISGSEYLSIYETALRIAEYYALPAGQITPVTTAEISQKARRPEKTGFILDKAVEILGYEPYSVTRGLDMYERESIVKTGKR